MDIEGQIEHLSYRALNCDKLPSYSIDQLSTVLRRSGASILRINSGELAVSRWVSAKRTRSYPYTKVYDTIGYPGKRLTIIPIYKDEGADGDRDFLQFDTISLMTLLQVYVIIAYYEDAERNYSYENKITKQRLNIDYVRNKIIEHSSFLMDPLHWNMKQLKYIGEVGALAVKSYSDISRRLGVKMHSEPLAWKKVNELNSGIERFKSNSRALAIQAQKRESVTLQPKEYVEGEKATITITNLYNGFYAFTVDEAFLNDREAYLVEAKHSSKSSIPSLADIKDGLLKMVIYSNLSTVSVEGKSYVSVPVLKLTSSSGESFNELNKHEQGLLARIRQEGSINGFRILFNGEYL